jgi:hypothetical protein
MTDTPTKQYDLTAPELKLLSDYHADIAKMQTVMETRYHTMLSTLLAIRSLPEVAGGYKLTADGKAFVVATPPAKPKQQ